MTTYYKITNNNEYHYGYKYKDGLNILDDEFNENIYDECGKGGFYFTTDEHIHKFYYIGDNLRIVELPLENPNFKMVKINDKFRANMIILKEKYNFNNLNDIKKILNINPSLDIITKIYNTEILDWFVDENYDLTNYISKAIVYASYNNYVDVLEWFNNSNYDFVYDTDAINMAAYSGNINVLYWFKNSGHEFKYNKKAINYAIINGHIDVLNWFKNSDYEFKFNKSVLTEKCHNIEILEWFNNNYIY
jgi:hypothetical protein